MGDGARAKRVRVVGPALVRPVIEHRGVEWEIGACVRGGMAGLMTYRMSGECVRVEQAAMGLMSRSVCNIEKMNSQ